MKRITNILTSLGCLALAACAGPPPVAEPGMEVIFHDRDGEMQVSQDVDWSRYDQAILHTAPVQFRDNWRRDQERLHGRALRDEDVERIEKAISGQITKALFTALPGRGGFEMTDTAGPDVLRFRPNIVDLDVAATGWVESSILESLPDTRGYMTVELVIRDSVTDEVLAVGWQELSDPREGDMDMTTNVSNAVAFRQMAQRWAGWVVEMLEEARLTQ